MRISVIIPTLNAASRIGKLLSMLSVQEIKPSEIIIIDSSSEDNTVELAKGAGADTIVIPGDAFDHGRTRNTAALRAKGDVLVFMTQDALPLDGSMIRNLISPIGKSGIAASYGRQLAAGDASPLEVFARGFNYPDIPATKSSDDISTSGIKAFFFSNVCSAVDREIFLRAGMFPEGIRTNEDMFLAARLILGGNKIAYVPDALVIHSHNYSLSGHFRRYYNIGTALRSNGWILKYARPEGEGLRFAREEFRFVLGRRMFGLMPYVLLEHIAKYAGYRMGLMAG